MSKAGEGTNGGRGGGVRHRRPVTPTARLAPPAARQGPGAMPSAAVDALDLALDRRVGPALPGDRRAAGTGPGTELQQLRPYEVGDDVRHLDPAATARTGVPHVRLHVPERALTTWIALDISPSMAFGTAARLKADVAEGAALVFGRLAVRRAGSVAVCLFGAGPPLLLPPRGAKPGMVALRRALAQGVAADGHHHPRALADALGRIGKAARAPGLVTVISDFRDHDGWTRPLGALRARHSVIAVEIGDPREAEVPPVGRVALVDPETGVRMEVDTSRARVRARFAELERERREAVAAELRRLRVEHVALSTDRDWLADLGRGLSLGSAATTPPGASAAHHSLRASGESRMPSPRRPP